MKKTDPKKETKPLVAKVPLALIRQLDEAARISDRTRSAELRVRLEASFSNAKGVTRGVQVRGAR